MQPDKVYPPSPEFVKKAHINDIQTYTTMWQASVENPARFWQTQASKFFGLSLEEDEVLGGSPGNWVWFPDSKFNVSEYCLDQHAKRDRDKLALIWEGEAGEIVRYTYGELLQKVTACAGMLTELGLVAGDVLTIYMPMIPETAIAMLACARIGVSHNVVFAGFSASSLGVRIKSSGSRYVLTADYALRKGAKFKLKEVVDQALVDQIVDKVIVFPRASKADVLMQSGRDVFWESGEPLAKLSVWPANHPLFLLYTSGSTGKPKGIMHGSMGYLLGVSASAYYVLDMQEDDIFWCTADFGWITGHSYGLYGPLALGATLFLYEGFLGYPDWERAWQLISKHRITKFYTAPTAIRSFMKYAPQAPQGYDLSSLRLLGSVGEMINPSAWHWFYHTVGQGNCPLVDTWWQTETGAIMMAPLPGVHACKPGAAMRPFFSVNPAVVDAEKQEQGAGQSGALFLKQPWPSMMLGVWGEQDRFHRDYERGVFGDYWSGDGAFCDQDGDYWILGRMDDVLNVAGHRLSTMELESALVKHPAVVEAAVVAQPHEVKGEGLVCFVTLATDIDANADLKSGLESHLVKEVGAVARPEAVYFTEILPKTRSGKIMRRLLRQVAMGKSGGDLSTLEDEAAFTKLVSSFSA